MLLSIKQTLLKLSAACVLDAQNQYYMKMFNVTEECAIICYTKDIVEYYTNSPCKIDTIIKYEVR